MKFKSKVLSEQDEMEMSDMDFDNASLSKVWDYINLRLSRKPMAVQAEMYKSLLDQFIGKVTAELPKGERTLLLTLKDFKKNNL